MKRVPIKAHIRRGPHGMVEVKSGMRWVVGAGTDLPPVPAGRTRLFRAALNGDADHGANFARRREVAEAYQKNPGFGGPTLFYADVDDSHRIKIGNMHEAREVVAEALRDHGVPNDAPKWLKAADRRAREDDETPDYDEIINEHMTGDEYTYPHDIVADVGWVRTLLGKSYDWVTHPDSFPPDAETWTYLGDEAVETHPIAHLQKGDRMILPILKPDGFGGFDVDPDRLYVVSAMAMNVGPMEKAVASATVVDAGPIPTWSFGAYTFKFRKGTHGLGVLSIEGGKLPMPFHLVVGGPRQARTAAMEAMTDFEAGRIPKEGVFRKELITLQKGTTVTIAGLVSRRIMVKRLIKAEQLGLFGGGGGGDAKPKKGASGAPTKKHPPKGENEHWITMNGSHVLVAGQEDGSHKVVGGAGMEGKTLHRVAVKAHVRAGEHGPTLVNPHERQEWVKIDPAKVTKKIVSKRDAEGNEWSHLTSASPVHTGAAPTTEQTVDNADTMPDYSPLGPDLQRKAEAFWRDSKAEIARQEHVVAVGFDDPKRVEDAKYALGKAKSDRVSRIEFFNQKIEDAKKAAAAKPETPAKPSESKDSATKDAPKSDTSVGLGSDTFAAMHAKLLTLPGLNKDKFGVVSEPVAFARRSKGRDDAIPAGRLLTVGGKFAIAAESGRKKKSHDDEWVISTTARGPITNAERSTVWRSMLTAATESTEFIARHAADDARDESQRDADRIKRAALLAELSKA